MRVVEEVIHHSTKNVSHPCLLPEEKKIFQSYTLVIHVKNSIYPTHKQHCENSRRERLKLTLLHHSNRNRNIYPQGK